MITVSQFFKKTIYWLSMWVMYVIIILAIGAVIGFLLTPLLKIILALDETGFSLYMHGGSIGVRYAGVWAGGLAIVLCFMKGYKMHQAAKKNNQNR